MGHKEVLSKCEDLNNLTNLLKGLADCNRTLIGSVMDMNNLPMAKKDDIKKALNRANKLGNIIDDVIKVIDNKINEE